MTDAAIAKMSFEEALGELERIVGELDSGDVALEQSIKLYERGALLRAHCDARLKEAEAKIATITLDADGTPKGTQPFETP